MEGEWEGRGDGKQARTGWGVMGWSIMPQGEGSGEGEVASVRVGVND